jgi:hypothetical protein
VSDTRGLRQAATLSLSAVMVVLGLVLVVEGLVVGGSVGVVLGLLFAAAGVLRIWLVRRGPR